MTNRQIVPGDPITAIAWNDLLRRLNALEQRGRSRTGKGGFVPAVATPFVYQSSDGDVLIGRQVYGLSDPPTVSSEDVPIAKPYTHRPSVLFRGGHTYAYTSDFERTDTLGGNVETQVLTPEYIAPDPVGPPITPGDWIYALRAPQSSGVFYDPLGGAALAPVEWIQVNVDGRAWAKKFGT